MQRQSIGQYGCVENNIVKSRDQFFDIVKAVAIFLAVFCHVMGLAPEGVFPQWFNNFRVGVNMPIFFVISGYFLWPAIEKGDWRKLIKHLRSYFQPALFFCLLYGIVGFCVGGVDVSVASIAKRIMLGVFVDPWFITTLAECYVIVFLAVRIGRNYVGAITLLAIGLLAVICRPSSLPGETHLACVVNMLPCFAFGGMVLRKFDCRIWESRIWGGGYAF